MGNLFKKSIIVAVITVFLDFSFHYFLTRPMETLTYFVVKFLLAFLVATAFFDWRSDKKEKLGFAIIAGLIFSALMSIYYRAWEFFEAYAPFGSRAPDILGISRDNTIIFGGAWWLVHALFFIVGVLLARKAFKD